MGAEVRLKHIAIAGFRGFAAKQEFDLSADATVLVGVNGLGKTSLFDAILWCLSGKLPRVGEDDKVVSLYSSTGEANVALTLHDQAGDELSIRRNSDGSTQVLQVSKGEREFKGSSATSLLAETLWPEAASSRESESLVNSTLCQSVYLQQDRIRDFLDATSDQERFNIISQLIGTGPLTDFQIQLEKQRTSWTRATTQLQKDGANIEDRVDALKRQLEKLQKSAASGTGDSNPSWSEWWTTGFAKGLRPRSTPAVESIEATSSIDEALREIGTLRDACSRRKALAQELLSSLQREPHVVTESIATLQDLAKAASNELQNATARLDSARKRSAELRQLRVETKELQQQKEALALIALKLLGNSCPVCDQAYDVEATRARLSALLAGRKQHAIESPDADQEVIDLSAAEENARQTEEKAKKTLSDAESAIAKHSEWSDGLNRRIKELELKELDRSKLRETLATIATDCDQRDASLVQLRQDGERLALKLGQEIAISRLSAATADLQAAENELKTHRVMIEMRELTGKHANALLEELREAASKVALDKLREIEPFLQRIYARIDPHPAFRVVRFATRLSRGRGRLDAELHDREEDRTSDSPGAVLSSSQMNALAVSIFLSFNLALPRLPIEAALIDDPIQSLDDINLLGVIDLLRRTKDRRQLIVSTHDERFGRLLARKLRPTTDQMRTSVIELSSWTRNGPEVKQYDVQADPIGLRLIRAG